MNIIKTPTGIITVDEVAKVLTQAQYNALSDKEKNNGTYYITDDDGETVMDIIGNRDISGFGNTVKDAIYNIGNDKITSDQIKSIIGTNATDDGISTAGNNLVLPNDRSYYVKDTTGVLNNLCGLDSNDNIYLAQGEVLNHNITIGNNKTGKLTLNGTIYIGGVTLDQYIQNEINTILSSALYS